MGVSFARAYEEFEKEMAELKEKYLKEGCSEEEFQRYYEMRRADLNRDLAYARKKVSLNSTDDQFDDETRNALYKDYLEKLSITMELPSVHKYWWIDDIENPNLLKTLLSFSDEELSLIDLSVYQGLSQTKIAKMKGTDQPWVSRKLKKLYKKMKNSIDHT